MNSNDEIINKILRLKNEANVYIKIAREDNDMSSVNYNSGLVSGYAHCIQLVKFDGEE